MSLVVVTIESWLTILYIVALIYDNDSPKSSAEWTVCDGIANLVSH